MSYGRVYGMYRIGNAGVAAAVIRRESRCPRRSPPMVGAVAEMAGRGGGDEGLGGCQQANQRQGRQGRVDVRHLDLHPAPPARLYLGDWR